MNLREQIGTTIAEHRRSSKMTQRELSEASGISAQNITKIEHGRYNLSIDILEKICRPLGLKIRVSL